MTGRPPRYTAELAERILQQLTHGRGLGDICAEPGMPCVNTVRQWAADDIEGFAARYKEAREIGSQIMVDELITIGDDGSRDQVRRRN
jgi:hypothetical protein